MDACGYNDPEDESKVRAARASLSGRFSEVPGKPRPFAAPSLTQVFFHFWPNPASEVPGFSSATQPLELCAGSVVLELGKAGFLHLLWCIWKVTPRVALPAELSLASVPSAMRVSLFPLGCCHPWAVEKPRSCSLSPEPAAGMEPNLEHLCRLRARVAGVGCPGSAGRWCLSQAVVETRCGAGIL